MKQKELKESVKSLDASNILKYYIPIVKMN